MSDATICLLVLAATIALFVWNRLPVEVVALGSAVCLYATGLLSVDQLFAGFGDPVVTFIAALFIVSAGLNSSGVTAWVGQQLIARAGGTRRRLLAATMLLAAGLTALISVNGATAALLPMVVLLAVRLGRSPSGLAMPLAFAGHAGSLLVLTASPINVLVSETATQAGGRPFGFFEFAFVGVPLVAGTIAIAVAAGDQLPPRRVPRSLPPDLSGHARTLVNQYQLNAHAVGLQVAPSSPVAATPADTLARSAPAGLVVLGTVAPDQRTPRGAQPLHAGDIVVVSGDDPAIHTFAEDHGLHPLPHNVGEKLAPILLNRDLGVAEVVISPRSPLVGDTVYPGMSTDSGELVILAVQRQGHNLSPVPAVLASGDTLLVQGTWRALERNLGVPGDVLVVDSPAAVRRQAVPLGPGAKPALAIVAGMVILLAAGLVPPSVAALLAAGGMVLTRVLTMTEAYGSISWTTLVIVAGMFPLSIAMQQSGAADQLARLVVTAFGGNGHLLLLGLFLLTAVLGQVISNMATALIVLPIAVAASADVGVSVQPVLMCVAVAAAASFLTPIATPANLMVQKPGGYRFGDYSRLGLPMLAWFLVVAVALVPLVWPL